MNNPQTMSWGFLILMFVIFYFFLIVPQRKQKKKREEMLASLKDGDKIITIGGVFGTITNMKEDRIFLQIAENVEIKVTKSAIGSLQPDAAPAVSIEKEKKDK